MPHINIYEVVNEKRRESMVVLSALSRGKLLVRLFSSPPTEASQWRPEEFIVDQIAENIPLDDAERFLGSFAGMVRAPDWRATIVRL